jgi:hypothetical protein
MESKNKKKILIQIGTEFHYMVAVSLIEKYYPSSEFEVQFLVCKGTESVSRLENVALDSRYSYLPLSYNHNKPLYFGDVAEFLRDTTRTTYFHFISFLFHDPIFVYLSYSLKKKGTTIFLAPDGMGAYVKFTSSNLRSRLLNTMNAYKFYKRHGVFLPKLWFTSWDFGSNGYYDCIYAYSSTLPYISVNKKIIEVDYTLSEAAIIELKEVFSVDFSEIPSLENVVLIINDRHRLPKYETELLRHIKSIYPERTILFKKHPNQAIENLNYLGEFNNVYMIDTVFPVELLMATLKNSIIISSYSNSMLYYNPSCTYFWTYPVVDVSGELKKPIKRFNPKSYIKVVKKVEEIV